MASDRTAFAKDTRVRGEALRSGTGSRLRQRCRMAESEFSYIAPVTGLEHH